MKIIKGLNLTFSLSRMLGITSIKQKIARSTGIPTTSRGRQTKLGRLFGMK